MEPILAMRDVHKSFGALEVLKGISLTLERGGVLTLIGASGSGKSTLLRCINMLEVPNSGAVSIDGDSVALSPEGAHRHPTNDHQLRAIRSEIGMVFQAFNLWAHMTILENVMEAPLRVQKRKAAEVRGSARELLDKVGIADKADAFPAQLSGGQQQRAAIARALCINPKLMLFDEPTSALDPELEVEVLGVIKMLADEGRSMVLVTHDMKFAREVSDRIIFLHRGRVEEEGAVSQVFGATKSDRLRQFLAAAGHA